MDAGELDEDRATFDGVACAVDLVAVDPGPPGVGRPVVDADHSKPKGFLNCTLATLVIRTGHLCAES